MRELAPVFGFFLKCIDERDYDEGDDQGDVDDEWQDDDEDEDEDEGDEGDDDNDDESMLLDSGLASSEPPQVPWPHCRRGERNRLCVSLIGAAFVSATTRMSIRASCAHEIGQT